MRLLQGTIDRFDVEAAGRLGLGRNDWRALRLLVEGGAQAPRDIGAALGLTSGSVTTLIDRLEARGLVRRASDPADRRALIVHARPPAVPCRPRCLRPARRRHGAHRRPALGRERSDAATKQLLGLARLVEWARQAERG